MSGVQNHGSNGVLSGKPKAGGISAAAKRPRRCDGIWPTGSQSAIGPTSITSSPA